MRRPITIVGCLVFLETNEHAQTRLGPRELAQRIAHYLSTYGSKRPRF